MPLAELGQQDSLLRILNDLQTRVRNLETRDVLQNSAIMQGGLTIAGNGSIMVNGTGSVDVTGGGSVVVSGGGSIDVNGTGAMYVNGLRLSAVSPAQISAFASNFAVTTSLAPVVSTTLTVPAGFTTALIFTVGAAEIANGASGYIVVQSSVQISPSSGSLAGHSPALDMQVAVGATETLTMPADALVTGLVSGSTITIYGKVQSSTALAVNAYNAYSLSGIAVFLP